MTVVTGGREVRTELPLAKNSVVWRVNADPLVFLGGGRALLLQVAHPGVGAGVEQHSSYASDPWGRFFRTVDVMMKLSFGSPEVSARQARMLAKMHSRVVGEDERGTPYSAMDPGLQLWVWATLVDTAALVYELMRGALTPDERDSFYQDSKLVAYGCGVPEGGCPQTWGDFQAYIDRVVAEDLHVTNSARSVAHASIVPPLPSPVGRLSAMPVQLFTVGLMPPRVREQYGFEWDGDKERQLRRWIALGSLTTSVMPRPVREVGAKVAVARRRPMRIPWLQRRGAELTAQRLATFHPAEA